MEGICTVLMMPILLVFYSVAVIVGVTTEASTIFFMSILYSYLHHQCFCHRLTALCSSG